VVGKRTGAWQMRTIVELNPYDDIWVLNIRWRWRTRKA
jgi:hypothetical protein